LARVFIVDDNLMIRTLLAEIVGTAGHDVIGDARDGLEAPPRVQELRPDVVLLDLVMPGRSGLETLRHMLIVDPSLAVIVCSASLDQQKVIAAIRLGAKGFIVKPFDRETVVKAIDDVLEGADSRDGQNGSSTPITTSADASAESREFLRVSAALPVVVTAGAGEAPVETFTLNLSGGGLLLLTGALVLGACVNFSLDLAAGEAPIEGRARVVRVTQDGQSAVAFEHVSIADHERLIEFINERHRAEPAERAAVGWR
jgi:two-component system chemotaxis response regulator CheY